MKSREHIQPGPEDEYTRALEREDAAVRSGEFSADALHGLGSMINSFTRGIERDPDGEISMKHYEGRILQAIDVYEQKGYAEPTDGIRSVPLEEMRRTIREYNCAINRYTRLYWEIIARLLLWTANKMKKDKSSDLAR